MFTKRELLIIASALMAQVRTINDADLPQLTDEQFDDLEARLALIDRCLNRAQKMRPKKSPRAEQEKTA